HFLGRDLAYPSFEQNGGYYETGNLGAQSVPSPRDLTRNRQENSNLALNRKVLTAPEEDIPNHPRGIPRDWRLWKTIISDLPRQFRVTKPATNDPAHHF